jgi:hypothetical protein
MSQTYEIFQWRSEKGERSEEQYDGPDMVSESPGVNDASVDPDTTRLLSASREVAPSFKSNSQLERC